MQGNAFEMKLSIVVVAATFQMKAFEVTMAFFPGGLDREERAKEVVATQVHPEA